jgi:hypothetical protein
MMAFNANDTFKPFNDAAEMWKDMVVNFAGTFKPGNQNFKFKPMAGIGQAEEGIKVLFDMVPMDEATKRDIREKLGQACQSCEKVYDKYVAVTSDLTREGLQINQALIKGEAADTPALYDLAVKAFKEMSECVTDCLTDTPFESLKALDKALKDALTSLSDEEQTAKSFIAEMITLNNKIVKLYNAAAKESVDAFSNKKKDKVVGIEALATMAETLAETQKRLAKLALLPEPAMTKYTETVDNFTDLSQKQLDVLKAGAQIPAKWFFALTDTAGEIETRIKEMFDDAKTVSTEHFFTRWMENVESLTRNTVDKSELERTIPGFINTYADMLETARGHFRQYMVLPYATLEDLNKMEKKVKKAASKA